MLVREIQVQGADRTLALSVAEAGPGGRPLLLLHGFTGAKEDFSDWLDPLAQLGWHAVAPDQRGHGASPMLDDEASYSFDLLAADLLGLLDALGWGSATALGHSMGGMVLQVAALAHPERFDALVLMGTSHRWLAADRSTVEAATHIVRTKGMAALLEAQEALADDRVLSNDIDRRLKAERPDYKAFAERKLLASSPAMYAAMIAAITDPVCSADRLDALRIIEQPTLVLVGEHDQAFVEPCKRIADAMPSAQLVVIRDAAHSPQFENPDPWWTALREFLGRV